MPRNRVSDDIDHVAIDPRAERPSKDPPPARLFPRHDISERCQEMPSDMGCRSSRGWDTLIEFPFTSPASFFTVLQQIATRWIQPTDRTCRNEELPFGAGLSRGSYVDHKNSICVNLLPFQEPSLNVASSLAAMAMMKVPRHVTRLKNSTRW